MSSEQQLVRWSCEVDPVFETHKTWRLLARSSTRSKKWRTVAIVWEKGKQQAVWHTFDQNGTGGENWVEDTAKQAKVEAAASAIAQGFI